MATNRMLRTLLHLKKNMVMPVIPSFIPLNNVYKYFIINIRISYQSFKAKSKEKKKR